MRNISSPVRLTALASVLIFGLGALATMPTASASSTTKTLHFYEVGTGATLYTPGGKVVPGGITGEPKPGQLFDTVANLYAGTAAKHGKKVVGTDHVQCVFSRSANPVCDAQAAVGGSLVIATNRGGTQEVFPVLEGTGKFAGWAGSSVHHSVTDTTSNLTLVLNKTAP